MSNVQKFDNVYKLIGAMGILVDVDLKAFHSDFYNQDVSDLKTLNVGDMRVWVTRENGTSLCDPASLYQLHHLKATREVCATVGHYMVSRRASGFVLKEASAEAVDHIIDTMLDAAGEAV